MIKEFQDHQGHRIKINPESQGSPGTGDRRKGGGSAPVRTGATSGADRTTVVFVDEHPGAVVTSETDTRVTNGHDSSKITKGSVTMTGHP